MRRRGEDEEEEGMKGEMEGGRRGEKMGRRKQSQNGGRGRRKEVAECKGGREREGRGEDKASC